MITGVPLRQGILSETTPQEARTALGLEPDSFTILAMGGSQGARRLNELAVGMAALLEEPAQILHQSGLRNFEEVSTAVARLETPRVRFEVRPYFEGEAVAQAYRSAEIVICRCGISTLAEVTVIGIPALMVPLPTAYADHQTANARCVEKAGGGKLLAESLLTSEALAAEVQELQRHDNARNRMSAAGRALGRPHAADDVAKLALELGNC